MVAQQVRTARITMIAVWNPLNRMRWKPLMNNINQHSQKQSPLGQERHNPEASWWKTQTAQRKRFKPCRRSESTPWRGQEQVWLQLLQRTWRTARSPIPRRMEAEKSRFRESARSGCWNRALLHGSENKKHKYKPSTAIGTERRIRS